MSVHEGLFPGLQLLFFVSGKEHVVHLLFAFLLLNKTKLAIKFCHNLKLIGQNSFFRPLFVLFFVLDLAKKLLLITHAGFLLEPVFRIDFNGPDNS